MKYIAKWAWVGAVVFGMVLVGSGLFMVQQGRTAHDDVRDTLSSERIVTAEDAGIPLAAVTGPDEAKAQAEAIKQHALALTGGKTYAELARDDPNRATYLNSVTLRTALMESYLAFKVSDLVAGVGLIIVLLGLSHVVLGFYLGLVVGQNRARDRFEEASHVLSDSAARTGAAPEVDSKPFSAVAHEEVRRKKEDQLQLKFGPSRPMQVASKQRCAVLVREPS